MYSLPVFSLLHYALEAVVDLFDLVLHARGRWGIGHSGETLLSLGELLHLEGLSKCTPEKLNKSTEELYLPAILTLNSMCLYIVFVWFL